MLCILWVLAECGMTCIDHYSITQNIFTALKIPCALPTHSSIFPPIPPATTDIFYSLYSFSFSRLLYSQHYTVCSLSDWLLSLRNIYLSSSMTLCGCIAHFLNILLNCLNLFLEIYQNFY